MPKKPQPKPPPGTVVQRARDGLAAAKIFEKNTGVVAMTVSEVMDELDDPVGAQGACAAFVRDAEIAGQIARKLDALILLPEPLETLDGPVLFIVALCGIGIYRAVNMAKLKRGAEAASMVERAANRHAARHVEAAQARLDAVSPPPTP
ncbi:hypothetical protein UFOVP1382_139 [uncultured Caudovirales phage]|uniref:Uncharacterized protein n=1 Tax=uncultured Caudovirales phage TaxID=2100421 RepID=A0A6J5S0P3_9CAUD|nr:hypothetical protein UFOVP1382_139 [uncultured Caudovirales phage]